MDTANSVSLATRQQVQIGMNQIRMLDLLAPRLDELEDRLAEFAMENPLLELQITSDISLPMVGLVSSETDSVANLPAPPPTWREDLLQQVSWARAEPPIRRLAKQLVLELEDDGLLRTSLETLAQSWAVEPARIVSALTLIQELDPPGVGARSHAEALWIQWVRCYGERDPMSKVARALLAYDPADSAELSVGLLARSLKATEDDLQLVLARLRRFNLSPVSVSEPNAIVRPDVSVWLDHGGLHVQVHHPTRSVAINSEYRLLSRQATLGDREKAYLRRHLQEARWIVDGLRKRQETLYRLAVDVFSCQRDFLEHGPSAVRPLRRRDVADHLNLHPSTVGRALANKTAATPWGCQPFALFFPRSLGRSEKRPGETGRSGEVSVSQVREWIRQAIAQEDPLAPRNDASLALQLTQSGIPIARRTVAKYREEMGIPTSRARRSKASGPSCAL